MLYVSIEGYLTQTSPNPCACLLQDDVIEEINEAIQEEVNILQQLDDDMQAGMEEPEAPPEERILTQETMAQEMLPRAQLAWESLLLRVATEQASKSISVAELEKVDDA